MDPLGNFHKGVGKLKFFIVVAEYFTKWIEAELPTKIMATKVIKFFKKNILFRFGITQFVVTNKGTQFSDKRMRELLEDLNIKQHFTSVEHPQTNGQEDSVEGKIFLMNVLMITNLVEEMISFMNVDLLMFALEFLLKEQESHKWIS